MSALMSALEAIHANGSGFSEEVNWIYCNFTNQLINSYTFINFSLHSLENLYTVSMRKPSIILILLKNSVFVVHWGPSHLP